jgi:hypothetical protein
MLRLLSFIAVLGIAGCVNQDGQIRKKKTEAEYRELEAALKADIQRSRTPKTDPQEFSDFPEIAKPK